MNIWIASMECATISEAGGVKNVVYSLCNEFKKLKNQVTLFIPVFKCTSFSNITELKENKFSAELKICDSNETISYTIGKTIDSGFDVVFINHQVFAEKEAVYTYTENEEKIDPNHKRGTGHSDTLFIDSLFAKAVAEYSRFVSKDKIPDVILCQDASTATIPLYAKSKTNLSDTKNVVTIHNAGPAYHHYFKNIDEAVLYTGFDKSFFTDCLNSDKVEPFLIAEKYGAVLTTVSEDYAKEITNPHFENETEGLSKCFFEKKIKITGITNGIDYELYNPTNPEISKLPFAFNPEKNDLSGKYECRKYFINEVNSFSSEIFSGLKIYGSISKPENQDRAVYISYHGRIASQKGLQVLADSIKPLVEKFSDLRFVIMGQGEREIENRFISLANDFDGKLIFLNGYNKTCARLSVAACDFIVLPSFFEPCCLEDFIAQIYGTIPVAHKTGGLKKITDGKTGFLYENNTTENLISKLQEVISYKIENQNLISQMIKEAAIHVHQNYQWDNVVKNKYIQLFKDLGID